MRNAQLKWNTAPFSVDRTWRFPTGADRQRSVAKFQDGVHTLISRCDLSTFLNLFPINKNFRWGNLQSAKRNEQTSSAQQYIFCIKQHLSRYKAYKSYLNVFVIHNTRVSVSGFLPFVKEGKKQYFGLNLGEPRVWDWVEDIPRLLAWTIEHLYMVSSHFAPETLLRAHNNPNLIQLSLPARFPLSPIGLWPKILRGSGCGWQGGTKEGKPAHVPTSITNANATVAGLVPRTCE